MAQSSPQSQPSLPSLPLHLQSDTHITAHLASRFHLALPTATISSHAIVSLNTYTSPNVAGVEIESMANRMWKRLRGRGENQAAVFLGESGSGKTTLRSHLISSLLSFTSTPLSHKISLFAFIFDTLTTTKSLTTPTASKAGLFLELQYDHVAQTLIGGKLLDHRLERSRVANVPTGERNFHILYYLLSGTSDAEKEHLGLNTAATAASNRHSGGDLGSRLASKRWRYLGHPTQMKVGINDAQGFQHFKTALRKLEFPRNEIAEICQILATILHIGQLEFSNSHSTTANGEESGAMEAGDQVVAVRNKDVLGVIAAFLGVSPDALESSLGYRTKTLNRERVTVMLDAKGARAHADELARTLYSLLVAWIIESCNERLCAVEDAIANTISIIDFPGFAQASSTGSTLDQLLNNAATESLYNFCLQSFFERRAEQLEGEEVAVPATSYFDNTDAVKALLKPGNGLLSILDDQTKRGRTDTQFLDSLKKRFESKSNPAISIGGAGTLPGSKFSVNCFTVKHFAGEVDYPVQGLIEQNNEVISADLMNLFQHTTSTFISDLFNSKAITAVSHPREKSAIMQGQVSSKPLRMPSVMRKKGERPNLNKEAKESSNAVMPEQGAAGQFVGALDVVTRSLTGTNTNPYFIFCLKPNDRRIANQFDSKCVRTQIRTLGIAEISQRIKNADFSMFLPFGEFLGLAEAESIIVGSEREKAEVVVEEKGWQSNEARVGATGIFLSEKCWLEMAQMGDGTRHLNAPFDPDDGGSQPLTPVGEIPGGGLFSGSSESRVRLISGNSPSGGLGGHIYGAENKGYFNKSDDLRSEGVASAFNSGDMFKNFDTRQQMAEKGQAAREEEIDEVPVTASRKRWMFVVWLFTFLIPDFLIRIIGRIPRKDMQTAWREKMAINMMIWMTCGIAVFFLVVFPNLICPKQDIFTFEELSSWDGGKDHMESTAYVSIRGIVFDLTSYIPSHYPGIIPRKNLLAYGGRDATNLFPVQVSALCGGVDGVVDDAVQFSYKGTNATQDRTLDANAKYHDFRSATNDSRPDWFLEQMMVMKSNFKVGDIGFSAKDVARAADKQAKDMAIIDGRVYDMTEYNRGGRQLTDKDPNRDLAGISVDFMDQGVVDLFTGRAGQDITPYWNTLIINPDVKKRMKTCLDRLFYVGKVDTRNSTQCLFARYLLLAISVLLVSVIAFKFFAALQFTKRSVPENLDKFVICQVPAYTEDEDSLRRAIDSVARMQYDDKRKLLVVVCDGMIIGQGNDRPTPRIVLDILGVPESVDPEPLSFESLGEGQKQHNMGKIYSGLYETHGHIVPFLVVVKVGKPSEMTKPGNRGKRDSQMILMRFLNRVHYNSPMSPMELEIHHQIRNIIGVNPTFYEFILQIDADTVVAPDSGTRMVSAFLADTRIIALCGETGLNNAKHSFITMIQVYEYYISHNLAKAFESLFGSVTCLPGCFSMYRIRAAETGKPLFVSREITDAYAEIRVDTLHMKNLLHLGEDRYLTTLLLKHHPSYKTKYIMHAQAHTIAPDSWSVFMSQRRRWINSTLHNLAELVPMQQLCGFCCFSMRFIVFLDLLSTIIAPVTVGYLAYLIYMVSTSSDLVPMWAFVLLAAVYGLQAIIFILRRKWEMIGWMILYIIAIPVFSFALPLYSFWHMDDFSWGNTRIVTGEKGQKIVISDEGKFDPAIIPRKKWEDYQTELWEAQTQRGHDDTRSEVSGYSYGTKSYAPAQSEYGGYAPPTVGYQSRPMSQLQLPDMRGQSRLSMAPSEVYSARAGYDPALEMQMLDLPSDDAILAEIREILRTADLMTVTKKQIRYELERKFGMSLEAKRAYVNSATEAILGGNL